VDVGGHHINTIKLGSGPPLVMIHGFGGGVGIWIGNLDALAQHYTIYALDLLGFGRSSRPMVIGTTPEEAEQWFLDGIDLWIKTLNLNQFYLLGHSFGGYLAGAYALKYPHKLKRLILADPWGVPVKPENSDTNLTWKWQAINLAANYVTSPFSILRALGPAGPALIDKFRPDLHSKFSSFFTDTKIMSRYIYHCNAQSPTGEVGFRLLQIPFGWAKLPLQNRLHEISPDLPVTVIYGEHTWMDYVSMVNLLPSMKAKTEVLLLPNAGHHVYIDSNELFNISVIAAKDNLVYHLILQENLRGWCNYRS